MISPTFFVHSLTVTFFPILILFSPVFAQETEDNQNHVKSFISGSYEVIGRGIDSKQTYSGKMQIILSGDSLAVIREINGNNVHCPAEIMERTTDLIPVLVVRFTQDNQDMEITYLISSDLDNYARLTGYVYYIKQNTMRPGLEALFPVK